MSTGTYLDRCFFDPIAECLTQEVARRVLNVRIDPVTVEHITQLAEKANAERFLRPRTLNTRSSWKRPIFLRFFKPRRSMCSPDRRSHGRVAYGNS